MLDVQRGDEEEALAAAAVAAEEEEVPDLGTWYYRSVHMD
jgi:hypothetical protein